MTLDSLPGILVETSWLAAHLQDRNLRIVDARWRGDGSSRQRYEENHIPGAIHLDWQLDLSASQGQVRYTLLPPDQFAEVAGRAGIGDQTMVVAYADQDYSGAARLWWALHYYGHQQAAVLNGGLDKWIREGRPSEAGPVQVPSAIFSPQIQPELHADRNDILQSLGDSSRSIQLVDTRPPEQYAGQAVWTPEGSRWIPSGEEWIDTGGLPQRGGHIPGAIHLLSSANLDPADWTYLPPAELRARAFAAGLRPENRIITYCGSGISASLGLLALRLAGFTNLALYDASWEEWGTDPNHPIEKG